jgi:hypothetical protein
MDALKDFLYFHFSENQVNILAGYGLVVFLYQGYKAIANLHLPVTILDKIKYPNIYMNLETDSSSDELELSDSETSTTETEIEAHPLTELNLDSDQENNFVQICPQIRKRRRRNP